MKFALQLASLVVLARLLSPVEFGLVAMVAPVVGFVQLFNEFGLTQAIVQRPSVTHRQLSSIFWLNFCISCGLALSLALAAPLVGWFYGEPRTVPITAALAAMLLPIGLAVQPMALLARQMRFTALAAIDVAAAAAATVAGIIAAVLGAGYWSLVAMQAAHFGTILVLAWALSGWRPSRPRWDPGVASLLRFGGNLTGYSVVNYLAYNMDKVLIGAVTGTVPLGLYDRASKLLSTPMWQVVTPAARVAVPLLSRLQDAPEQYRRAYRHIAGAMLLATTPAIVCAVVLAETVIRVLIGEQWLDAAPLLAWMAFGTLLVPLNISIGWLFVSQGRTADLLAWGGASCALIVASFFVGLWWGVTGVAAAGAIFLWLFCTPLLIWAVSRKGAVRLPELLGASLPCLAGGAVSGIALWSAREHLADDGIVGLFVALVASYAVCVLVLACLPAGKRQLRETWALRSMLGAGGGAVADGIAPSRY